ncbi:MAG: thiamine-phosphate kinase [Alphaproteobacteria bacterium]|jgi:thiamine-monophosphate kinase|nr:thiamine-phosphate kinase [Alphaproteobacteria bacterium]MBT5828134.1 thiamine-phosphate kinase [Alphaproteobacteria bacterium]
MDEFSFIRNYLAPLAGFGSLSLGDDIALLDNKHDYGFSTDTMVENVHFLPNIKPKSLALRLISTATSDLIAKALTPKFYSLNLTLGKKYDKAWLAEFASGLKEAQQYYNMSLLGGDTTANANDIVLSATVFGVIKEKVILRSGAFIGDDIWVTRNIGDSFLGLEIAKKNLIVKSDYLLKKYLEPLCLNNLQDLLLKHATAALDISDGLIQDLKHLCNSSNCGANIEYNAIPLSKIAKEILNNYPKYKEKIINSGDDYEVLFTANHAAKEDILLFSKKNQIKITHIGKIIKDKDINLFDENNSLINITNTGFKHFALS